MSAGFEDVAALALEQVKLSFVLFEHLFPRRLDRQCSIASFSELLFSFKLLEDGLVEDFRGGHSRHNDFHSSRGALRLIDVPIGVIHNFSDYSFFRKRKY